MFQPFSLSQFLFGQYLLMHYFSNQAAYLLIHSIESIETERLESLLVESWSFEKHILWLTNLTQF